MSEAIDERVREMVRSSSIETREAVFEDLLRELMAVEPYAKSVPLHDSAGELLGFFVRPVTALPDDVPPFTPEEEAEHQLPTPRVPFVIVERLALLACAASKQPLDLLARVD